MVSAPHSSKRFEAAGSFRSLCHGYFLSASGLLLAMAVATKMLQSRLPFQNPRVIYGVAHLPAALCLSAVISAAAAFYLPLLRRQGESVTGRFALVSVWGTAALLWLPVVQASRFSDDDWFLVVAASIRHSLAARPWLAWYALDAVDGNFRPLGTVVYLNHGFPLLGFYAGFLCCVLAATLLYLLARRIGAQPKLALCAALLFVSRDLLYGPVVWLCSLGDDMVIASGAGCVLLLIGSLRATSGRAALCHLGAFACFAVALLSKQSAYCLPLLALLTLALRPGQEKAASTPRQWASALFTASVYLAATIGIFHHARHLSTIAATPYPIALGTEGIGYLLRSVLWFFGPLDMQIIRGFLTLENVLGAVILAVLLYITWKRRGRLGLRDREVAFFLLASFVSVALFLFLPSRRVPYYADFAVFWASPLIAALLVGAERRGNEAHGLTWVIAMVVLGGISIQLKRTALIPSGTYLGGTYGMDREAAEFATVRQALREHPHTTTVVVHDDAPDTVYPAMIVMSSREVRNVYVFRDTTSQWFVNGLNGSVPQDTPDAWTDVSAFHWTRPLAAAPTFAPSDRVLMLPMPSAR